MRLALAQLTPTLGDVAANAARLDEVARAAQAAVVVAPELYLSGYRIGDRFHRIALAPGDPSMRALQATAHKTHTALIVGAPTRSGERAGEVHNAVLRVAPDGSLAGQVKRYLPTFGPFEEGTLFTPTDRSVPVDLLGRRAGLEICYDAFFPEVSRDLAMAGAELLVVVSASPVTSRALFEKVLPARAVENGLPVVYVNRVGVEDGFVFGGGSAAWDSRGERIPARPVEIDGLGPDEFVECVEVDPDEPARWRPFRPVLRDAATRPGPRHGMPASSVPTAAL